MARSRAQRRQRKLRNQTKMKALLERTGPPRIRRNFFGKAQSGDAAELAFTFSGVPLPIDLERPSESLTEVLALIAS